MKLFEKIVNGFNYFLMFTKSNIIDNWLNPEYASVSIEKQMIYGMEGDGGKLCFNI